MTFVLQKNTFGSLTAIKNDNVNIFFSFSFSFDIETKV